MFEWIRGKRVELEWVMVGMLEDASWEGLGWNIALWQFVL